MLKKKKNIKEYISIGRKISKKINKVLSKDIDKLTIIDFSSLLKIKIAEQLCLNLILELIESGELKFEFNFKNKDSEQLNILLQQIILLDQYNWDINPKAFGLFKKIINKNIHIIKLKEEKIKNFLSYKPDDLEWNNNSISEFNSYMNDSKMGVFCGYNMLIIRKRKIINGGKIKYNLKDKILELTNLKEFEGMILRSIKVNKELKEILKNIKN